MLNEAQLSAGDAKAFAKSFKQMLRDIGVDPKESDYETMLWDFASSLKFDPKFDKIPDWSMADSIAGEFEKLIEDIYGMLISDENIFAPRLEENLDGIIQNLTEEFRMKSELFGKGTIVCKTRGGRGFCRGSVEISGTEVKPIDWLYDEKAASLDSFRAGNAKHAQEFTITFNGPGEENEQLAKKFIPPFTKKNLASIELDDVNNPKGFFLNSAYKTIKVEPSKYFKIKVTKWGKSANNYN